MPFFLALSMVYGGAPDFRQALVGGTIFFAIYSAPLILMAVTLHRISGIRRGIISCSVSLLAIISAAATPGGVLADGFGLFFAVIGLGAAIDLFHLKQPFPAIGIVCAGLSLLFVLAFTQPAFQHAILSSHRY